MRGPPPPQPTQPGTGEPAVANLIDLGGETPSPQPVPAAGNPFGAGQTNPSDIHLRLAGMSEFSRCLWVYLFWCNNI